MGDDVLARNEGRDLRARQDAGEIARHEGHLGVGLGAGRVIRRDRVAAAIVHQQARRIELRHVGGEFRHRQREVGGDAHERAHAHHLAVAGAAGGRDADDVAGRIALAGARQLVGLAGRLRDAFVAGERAAQRGFDPLRQGGEIRFAVERDVDRAAHQRGAAEPGEDRTGEPLHGDAAAVDDAAGRAVDQQRGIIAEIDRLRCCPQTIWIAPFALIQAPCPLRSPPRNVRGSPTLTPLVACTTQQRWRAQRGTSTRLPGTLDSYCDHWPYPDAKNAGGMWRECGTATR